MFIIIILYRYLNRFSSFVKFFLITSIEKNIAFRKKAHNIKISYKE